jgi:hypothetical protein
MPITGLERYIDTVLKMPSQGVKDEFVTRLNNLSGLSGTPMSPLLTRWIQSNIGLFAVQKIQNYVVGSFSPNELRRFNGLFPNTFEGYLIRTELYDTLMGTGALPAELLDAYPGAAAAYSVRKLSSTYSGSAIRVRRSSTNTEQDIGFDSNGDLDTAALTSFVGAQSGFITIWYDQSGNGRNATQTIAGSQPRIVNAGVIELQNSLPSVRLLGSQYLEIQTSVSNLLSSANITHIFSAMIQTSSTGTLVGAYQSGSTNRYVVHPTFSGNMYFDCYSDVTSRVTGTQAIFTALTMVDYYRENANMAYYRNNISIYTKNNATGVFTAYLTKTNLGANRNPSNSPESYMTGFISEFIIYNTSQNSNRNGINTNIMTYYSI